MCCASDVWRLLRNFVASSFRQHLAPEGSLLPPNFLLALEGIKEQVHHRFIGPLNLAQRLQDVLGCKFKSSSIMNRVGR